MNIQRIVFTLTLGFFVAGCIDRIPPTSLIKTRMFVTKPRILQYAHTTTSRRSQPPLALSVPLSRVGVLSLLLWVMSD